MPGWIKEAFDGYISKLNHDFSPQLVEIKPEKKFDSIEQKKISESEKILSHLDKEFLIVLDEKGVQFTSQELAQKLNHWSEHFKDIAFVIGGADGIHETDIDLHDGRIMFQSHIAGNWNDNCWNKSNYEQVRLSLAYLLKSYKLEFKTLNQL